MYQKGNASPSFLSIKPHGLDFSRRCTWAGTQWPPCLFLVESGRLPGTSHFLFSRSHVLGSTCPMLAAVSGNHQKSQRQRGHEYTLRTFRCLCFVSSEREVCMVNWHFTTQAAEYFLGKTAASHKPHPPVATSSPRLAQVKERQCGFGSCARRNGHLRSTALRSFGPDTGGHSRFNSFGGFSENRGRRKSLEERTGESFRLRPAFLETA